MIPIQSPSSPPPTLIVPELEATRRTDSLAPEDSAWERAARIERLTLAVGPEAAHHTALPTEVRLLWSPSRLCIRFVCQGGDSWSPFGDTWGAPHYQGDVTEVFLDPVGDGRQFLELEVSPKNGVFSKLYLATAEPKSLPDGLLSSDFLRRDEWEVPNWTISGLETRTSVLPSGGGWAVVIVLPAQAVLRRLGQSQFSAGMTLRANFLRYDYAPSPTATGISPGNKEIRTSLTAMNWSPIPWGRPHRAPSLMGRLVLAAP